MTLRAARRTAVAAAVLATAITTWAVATTSLGWVRALSVDPDDPTTSRQGVLTYWERLTVGSLARPTALALTALALSVALLAWARIAVVRARRPN